MEITDYCDYELSLALKKAGFDWECDSYYDCHFNLKHYATTDRINRNTNGHHTPSCSAPTLAVAQKWLREKKEIVVIVDPDWDSEDYCLADYLTGKWYFIVWEDGDRVHCNFDPDAEEERIWMFDSYEQALSAGIAAALELIEKGV